MTRDEQIKTLEDILVLEVQAMQLSDVVKKIKYEKFRNPPKSPDKPIEHRPTYPSRKFSLKKVGIVTLAGAIAGVFAFMADFAWWIIPLLAGVALVVSIGLYLFLGKQYKQDVMWAEEDCKKRNEKEQLEYEERVKQFNEAMVKHRTDKATWEEDHKNRYDSAVREYNDTIDAINNIYADSKIIPLQYRNVEVVSYLYDYMSSSEADIQQGLVSYDSHVQHELTQSHIREQQITNALTDRSNEIAQHQAELTMEQNMIAARQNELAEESNAIAEKTRRDQNIAAAISILQRHNANKKLGDIDRFNRYGY